MTQSKKDKSIKNTKLLLLYKLLETYNHQPDEEESDEKESLKDFLTTTDLDDDNKRIKALNKDEIYIPDELRKLDVNFSRKTLPDDIARINELVDRINETELKDLITINKIEVVRRRGQGNDNRFYIETTNNDVRLLVLYKILEKYNYREEANFNKSISIDEIISIMKYNGINCSKQQILADINRINHFVDNSRNGINKSINYELIKTINKDEVNNKFGTDYSPDYAQIYSDIEESIISNNSITKSEKDNTIMDLRNDIIPFGFHKHLDSINTFNINIEHTSHTQDEDYYKKIKIIEAITQKKRLKFKYVDFNFILNNSDKVTYRKGKGYDYEVEPIAKIFKDGYYYLLANKVVDKKQQLERRTYRIDRIDMIRVTDVSISEETQAIIANSEEEAKKVGNGLFHMYGSDENKTTPVTFKVKNTDISQILYDSFDEDKLNFTRSSKSDEEEHYSYTFKADIQVSPTFWAWLFQLGNDIEIIAPKELRDEYFEQLGKIISNYDTNNLFNNSEFKKILKEKNKKK